MPKKYKQKSLLTKPTSSAPSNLSLSRAGASQVAPTKKSVNDLIRESRQHAGNEGSNTVPSGSSVHPALRAVLDMPAPPQPVPRHGIRGATRLRRIPGPPPPQSWLLQCVQTLPERREVPWSKAHKRTRIGKQVNSLPEVSLPEAGSLQDNVMRHMASNWVWHAEYDHEYLAELPTKIKQSLLSYIALYNDTQSPNPLRLLFPGDLEQDELDEVRRLDLGNAIGGWATLKKIEKELESNHLLASVTSATVVSQDEAVPDSWDIDEKVHQSPIPKSVVARGIKFRNLKHLSLAIALDSKPSAASWGGLLGLASKLSTISSLSLANWPQPTLTPNASNGLVKLRSSASSSIPAVTYGGTNFYSAFDNDWREAAGILRTLSRSLYCLKWLDLTGCGDWFTALTWRDPDGEDTSTAIGPDWNGSWRQLEHLNLLVGWTPGPVPVLQYAATSQSSHNMESARNTIDAVYRPPNFISQGPLVQAESVGDTTGSQSESWDVEHERENNYHRMEMTRYEEIIERAKTVARDIRDTRKKHGGKWIDIEISPKGEFLNHSLSIG